MQKRIVIPHSLSSEEAMDRCDQVLTELRARHYWLDLRQKPWHTMIADVHANVSYKTVLHVEGHVSMDVRKDTCLLIINFPWYFKVLGRWRTFAEEFESVTRQKLALPSDPSMANIEQECRHIRDLLRLDMEDLKSAREKYARELVKVSGWAERMRANSMEKEALVLDAYVIHRQAVSVRRACLDFEFCSRHN